MQKFFAEFFWLKSEGRKKKSRQPPARYVVFLTKAAPTDQRHVIAATIL
jgi:hypothetical protein